MTHGRPTISTHVLDTAVGRPRPGVEVSLRRLDGAASSSDDAGGGLVGAASGLVGRGVTDADGRIADLLGGGALVPGRYRLEFALDANGFFTALSVDLNVEDVSRGYHVPLLLAPFGLSTYRGS